MNKKLEQWLIDNKDVSLGTAILNIRQLSELNERQINELHQMLWLKYKAVMKSLEMH